MTSFNQTLNQDVSEETKLVGAKPRASLSDFLAGEVKDFKADLKPYLPQELIGGSVPHIPGMEEDSVWNAASQACGTEKVHYSFTADAGRVWYLACPSSSLASNPDSWCPLAAALPGRSEHWDKQTVYLYEQEGLASALRWDPETGRIQVFLGASRTILPRVQSMDANFVTVNPAVADVIPWQNRTLKTEKLARATVRMLILSGLVVNLLAFLILMFNVIGVGYASSDLESVKKKTDQAALALMENASNVMQSDTIKHMVRIQEILDTITAANGHIVRYEVKGGKVEWQAIIPQAYVTELGKKFGELKPKPEQGDMVRITGKK